MAQNPSQYQAGCKAGLTGNLSCATNKPDQIYMGIYMVTNVVVLLSPTIELGINMGITFGDAKYKQIDTYNRKGNTSVTHTPLRPCNGLSI